MPKSAGLLLLEEKTKEMLDVLMQIHFQSQKQRDMFEKANPEDIQDFAALKNQRLRTFRALLEEIQGLATKIRADAAADKAVLDGILAECEKKSRTLIDEIIAIETTDKLILDKLKIALSTEIDEVKKARVKLDALKDTYGAPQKDRTLFDNRS